MPRWLLPHAGQSVKDIVSTTFLQTLGVFGPAANVMFKYVFLFVVFGSFLAGSTPAGAGAVAFPVFTKALDIVPEVARTFTLSIQAIGLTVASIIILISRRNIEPRAVAVGVPVGLAGFFLGWRSNSLMCLRT